MKLDESLMSDSVANGVVRGPLALKRSLIVNEVVKYASSMCLLNRLYCKKSCSLTAADLPEGDIEHMWFLFHSEFIPLG